MRQNRRCDVAPSLPSLEIWSTYDKYIIKQNKSLCVLFQTNLQGNQTLGKSCIEKFLERKNWKETEVFFT